MRPRRMTFRGLICVPNARKEHSLIQRVFRERQQSGTNTDLAAEVPIHCYS